ALLPCPTRRSADLPCVIWSFVAIENGPSKAHAILFESEYFDHFLCYIWRIPFPAKKQIIAVKRNDPVILRTIPIFCLGNCRFSRCNLICTIKQGDHLKLAIGRIELNGTIIKIGAVTQRQVPSKNTKRVVR